VCACGLEASGVAGVLTFPIFPVFLFGICPLQAARQVKGLSLTIPLWCQLQGLSLTTQLVCAFYPSAQPIVDL
jgi:hypothetical protein